jgi:hypothetical protein
MALSLFIHTAVIFIDGKHTLRQHGHAKAGRSADDSDYVAADADDAAPAARQRRQPAAHSRRASLSV